MARATKKKSALYKYLEPVLQTGTPEDIAEAKKQYWKDYKKRFNKEKYANHTCFKILLTPQELKALQKAAKDRSSSPTNFIKQATLAATKQAGFVDKATLAKVREMLVLYYGDVESYLEEQNVHQHQADDLLQRLAASQDALLDLLISPNHATPTE